jgi:phosphate transport system protein
VQLSRHTDQQFRAQLQELKDRLLAMGGRCERLISRSLQAIEEGDGELANEVQSADRLINADELAVDELAVRILALRQPVGRDLRFLVTALEVVGALERIGDEAVNVSERVPLIAAPVAGLEEARRILPEMGRTCSDMLKRALDAFVAESAEQANTVLAMDDEVDRLYEQEVALVTRFMSERPADAAVALGMARTAKYLERIADLCTNVAEMVVYMAQGVDVRHGGRRRHRKG